MVANPSADAVHTKMAQKKNPFFGYVWKKFSLLCSIPLLLNWNSLPKQIHISCWLVINGFFNAIYHSTKLLRLCPLGSNPGWQGEMERQWRKEPSRHERQKSATECDVQVFRSKPKAQNCSRRILLKCLQNCYLKCWKGFIRKKWMNVLSRAAELLGQCQFITFGPLL